MRGKDEDYTLSTRARLLERIKVTVAGRAAEQVFQENISTYSRNDILVRPRCSFPESIGLLPLPMHRLQRDARSAVLANFSG